MRVRYARGNRSENRGTRAAPCVRAEWDNENVDNAIAEAPRRATGTVGCETAEIVKFSIMSEGNGDGGGKSRGGPRRVRIYATDPFRKLQFPVLLPVVAFSVSTSRPAGRDSDIAIGTVQRRQDFSPRALDLRLVYPPDL